MSKAFTKEDAGDEPLIIRHRPPLPEGTPNYVTARGMQSLRAELAASEPGPRRVELERRLGTAVLASPPVDSGEVRFGAHVTVRNEQGGVRKLHIVGVDEAEPAAGLLAFVAPLARALFGRRVGDVVTVRTPGGTEEIEIISLAYDADSPAR